MSSTHLLLRQNLLHVLLRAHLHHSGSSLGGEVGGVSLIQFNMVAMRSEKPICAPPRASEVSRNFSFETVPMFVRLTMAVSRPFKGRSSSASSFHASLFQAVDGVVWCGGVIAGVEAVEIIGRFPYVLSLTLYRYAQPTHNECDAFF